MSNSELLKFLKEKLNKINEEEKKGQIEEESKIIDKKPKNNNKKQKGGVKKVKQLINKIEYDDIEELKNAPSQLKDVETQNAYELKRYFRGIINAYVFKNHTSFNFKSKKWKEGSGNRTINDVYSLLKFKDDFIKIIKNGLKYNKNIKMNITIDVVFKKSTVNKKNEVIHKEFQQFLSTKAKTILNDSNLDVIFYNHVESIIEKINKIELTGSNWVLSKINELAIKFIKYNPLGAGKYIFTPPHISNKKCIINIKNENDNECFKYCILYHEYKDVLNTNPQRLSNYKNLSSKYKFDDIVYPVPIDYIDKFERINEHKISINVYRYIINRNKIIQKLSEDKNENFYQLHKMTNEELLNYEYQYSKYNKDYKIELEIYPNRITKNYIANNHVQLLLIEEEFNNEINGHYTYIKNLMAYFMLKMAIIHI